MTAPPVSLSAHLPLLAVLAAAVMHAAWNAMVKVSGDRLAALGLIDAWALLLALAAAPFVAFPPAAIWGYLLASLAVVTLYRVLLLAAYDSGDLSQVYPLMRGSAPLAVALLAAVVARERLPLAGYAGVALATGLTIACYTLIDSLGVRSAGDVLIRSAPTAWGCGR